MELENNGEKLDVVKVKNLRRSDIISYAGAVRHIYSRSVRLCQPKELYDSYIQGSHPPNHSTFQSKGHIHTWGNQMYLPNHTPRNAVATVCPVAIAATAQFLA